MTAGTKNNAVPERSPLHARLELALAGDDRAVQKLSSANTSVTFCCGARPNDGVTLLLDRRPPGVVGADEPAEIVIELTAEQCDLFASGHLVLPTAIFAGEVAYRGPVRKFMAVAPILRGLLARLPDE